MSSKSCRFFCTLSDWRWKTFLFLADNERCFVFLLEEKGDIGSTKRISLFLDTLAQCMKNERRAQSIYAQVNLSHSRLIRQPSGQTGNPSNQMEKLLFPNEGRMIDSIRLVCKVSSPSQDAFYRNSFYIILNGLVFPDHPVGQREKMCQYKFFL